MFLLKKTKILRYLQEFCDPFCDHLTPFPNWCIFLFALLNWSPSSLCKFQVLLLCMASVQPLTPPSPSQSQVCLSQMCLPLAPHHGLGGTLGATSLPEPFKKSTARAFNLNFLHKMVLVLDYREASSSRQWLLVSFLPRATMWYKLFPSRPHFYPVNGCFL